MSSAPDSWLVVGLGNPGTRYEMTRHNAGARTVEALARKLGWKMRSTRSRAWMAEGKIGDAQLWLARPKTYMNESGRAVAALVHSRQLDTESLIVVHDEIDLPAGSLRVKFSGGSAGNRGVESVVRALGSPDFYRVRIGVGRGEHFQDPSRFVLERIPKHLLKEHAALEARAAEAVLVLIEHGLAEAQNRFNITPQPEQ